MIALTYHAALARHWRGYVVHDMDVADVNRCAQDASLRMLDTGELGDGRLVFHESTRQAFEAVESKHGINRNVRFVGDPLMVNHFLDAHEIGGARVVEGPSISPSG